MLKINIEPKYEHARCCPKLDIVNFNIIRFSSRCVRFCCCYSSCSITDRFWAGKWYHRPKLSLIHIHIDCICIIAKYTHGECRSDLLGHKRVNTFTIEKGEVLLGINDYIGNRVSIFSGRFLIKRKIDSHSAKLWFYQGTTKKTWRCYNERICVSIALRRWFEMQNYNHENCHLHFFVHGHHLCGCCYRCCCCFCYCFLRFATDRLQLTSLLLPIT